MNLITFTRLRTEEKALQEIILDIEQRLKDERERFHAAGERTITAHTWREGTKVSLIKYKKQLVAVQKRIRELETPDLVLEEALTSMSLWEVLAVWWRA